jgi:hypothetical protein
VSPGQRLRGDFHDLTVRQDARHPPTNLC